ncbi:outer membrane protein assembly factor BamE [Brevibacillus sp. SYP-B805]|uniref:outer membrane protein assembly factor BamE domain-containing protein n=1 Tax=Brevibacillus sp. SYP-B805 TaxID=1578199 RepID=UPI0013E9B930|nr:outer membrane protein assembly factor BamE [Brevibacillus sp. SYP-B805]NGQ94147.1 outer membrane protein assembly factor BamE [Brevibacillus sp. SYP-B805]
MIDAEFAKKLIWKLALTVGIVMYVALYMCYNLVIDLLHSSFSIVSVPAVLGPYLIVTGILFVVWRNRKKGEKPGKRLVFGALAATAIFLYSFAKLAVNEYESRFTPSKWMAAKEKRVYMVDDLLERHQLAGMTRGEVRNLLGQPTDTAYFQEQNNWVYELGPERGLVRIDSEWLVIWFDTDGTVSRYRIMTD